MFKTFEANLLSDFITWQDEIFHVYWYLLRLCVCVSVCVCICVSSKNVSEFVRSLASRVLEIS